MPNNIAPLVASVIGTIQETARNTGFLANLTARDPRIEPAAQGQTISVPALPDIAAVDVTPAASVPEAADTTATGLTLTLSNFKAARFKLAAEDERALADLGANYRSEQIQLAIASIIDAYVLDLSNVMDRGAGVAFGTPGTIALGTSPNILADVWQSLADDKCPDTGRLAVLSTLEYAAATKLTQFQRLNEAPVGTNFAAGRLGMLANFEVGYDQAAGRIHTTTAAGGYLINLGAGYAAGATSLQVDTGTGGFAAGDIITIAGNFLPGTSTLAQMVVASFSGTTLVLTRGLFSAVADNASIVRIATNYPSFAGHRSAVYTSFRPPAEVSGGDQATVSQVIRDPVTGLTMRLAYYPGYHQGQWEVSAVYGSIVRRPSWLRKIIR